MRKIAFAALAGLSAAGCVASYVPEKPDFTLEASGSYQAAAECAFEKIRASYPDWSKVEFPSQRKSQLVFGTGSAQIGHIDFIGVGSNRVRVVHSVWQQIHGKNYWPSRLRPLIESCVG